MSTPGLFRPFAIFAIFVAIMHAHFPVRSAETRLADARRIEAAYRLGLERAAGGAERMEAAWIRVVSLNSLADLAYESTLAWLAERDAILAEVVRDQEAWFEERSRLRRVAEDESRSPGERMRALDGMAALAVARLRAFAAVTSRPEIAAPVPGSAPHFPPPQTNLWDNSGLDRFPSW